MKKNVFIAITITLIVLLLFSLNACKKKEESSGIPNPMVAYDSLEEINKKAGVHLVKADEAGINAIYEKESYYVISDKIAEYNFTINGIEYTLRGANEQEDDISGIYIDAKEAFTDLKIDYAVTGDDEVKTCRFLAGSAQYVLTAQDNGTISDNEFDTMCVFFKNAIDG